MEFNCRAARLVLLTFCFLTSLLSCAGQVKSTALPDRQSSEPNMVWTTFQDPFERAFSVDVPKGWTAKGGLFRLGYSDQRPMVDLRSPDGRISVRLGDVSIPAYANPAQFHQREGETYDLGAQAQMIVAKYRSGPQFAILYSHARFADACKDPQTDLSDSDFALPDYLPMETAPKQSSAGEVAYRCGSKGDTTVAFVYAKTMAFGDLWLVPTLGSCSSPSDRAALARNVLRHAALSFHVNPEWLAYQKRMDAAGLEYQRMRQQRRMNELQAQVQQFESQMRAMQSQVNAFERHQAANAAQVEGFTNALVGVTPTTDPLTGENRTVWTGTKNNYWVNGVGQVVNATNAPAPGWRQLQPQ